MTSLARRALTLAAVAAVAFFAFFLLDYLTDRAPIAPLSTAQRAGLLVLSLLTVYAILAIHEIGHIIGSRVVGLRMRSLTVGPITFVREAGTLRIRKNLNLALFRGVVRFEVAPDEKRRRRLTVVLAAGPAMSLVTGLLAVAFLLGGGMNALTAMTPAARLILARLLALFASGSIAVGLANIIPMRFAGGVSDGARLFLLLRRE
jgi:hypothetical protein